MNKKDGLHKCFICKKETLYFTLVNLNLRESFKDSFTVPVCSRLCNAKVSAFCIEDTEQLLKYPEMKNIFGWLLKTKKNGDLVVTKMIIDEFNKIYFKRKRGTF